MVATKSCNTIAPKEHLAVDAAGFVWLHGCFDGFSKVMLSHRYVILWEPARRSCSLKPLSKGNPYTVPGGETMATVAVGHINRKHFLPVNIVFQERNKIAVLACNRAAFHQSQCASQTKLHRNNGGFFFVFFILKTITNTTNSIRMCMTDITGSRDANSVNTKLHYRGKNTNDISAYEVYKQQREKLLNQSLHLFYIYYAKNYLKKQSALQTPFIIRSKELNTWIHASGIFWPIELIVASVHGWKKDKRHSLNISFCSSFWQLVRTWVCFLEGRAAF